MQLPLDMGKGNLIEILPHEREGSQLVNSEFRSTVVLNSGVRAWP